MITKELMNEINRAYHELDMKSAEITSALFHRIFSLESGWYSGHYHKTEEGNWQYESYPIPVISVKGLCDVEISFQGISVSTKLKRASALEYAYEKIKSYHFEAYGVEDYFCDFYGEGQTIEDLKRNIWQSNEEEIGFAFSFPAETNGKRIFEFAKLLRREGFYY